MAIPKTGPSVWYSFDKANERELFAPGVAQALRQPWLTLHDWAASEPPVADALKLMHPHQIGDKLTIYLAPQLGIYREKVEAGYGPWIRESLQQFGIDNVAFQYVDSEKAKRIGRTPTNTPYAYFGPEYLESTKRIRQWFLEGYLSRITIYDNLTYHTGNEYGKITLDDYQPRSAPASSPARTSMPHSVGSIMQHMNSLKPQPIAA